MPAYDARWYSINNANAGTPPAPAQGWASAPVAPPKWQRRRKRRGKLLLMLLAGALVITTVLIAANLYRSVTTLDVQVGGQQTQQIDLSQSVPVSPYLLGSNVFPRTGTLAKDQAGKGFMSYDQSVVAGLRSAGIKLLRFPGGNWGEEHTPSAQQLNAFSGLLNQVGAQGMMQVQLSDPLDVTPVPLQTRATRAALLVDYMNNSKSIQRTDAKAPFHAITYWTIGNEPDLLNNPDTQQVYTVEEYTQAFIAYSLAMHEKDPTIKVFGPEISTYAGQAGPKDASGKPWMEEFLREISAYERTHSLPFQLLDGVSFHYYPSGNTRESASALLASPARLNTLLLQLRQYIRQQFGKDLPLAITEINSNTGTALPSPQVAATWWADTLGVLMSNQVQYVAFFSTEGVDSPYPLFTRKGLQQTAMLRVMQLFARLQPDFVQSEQGPVSLYATQNQAHTTVSILFINKTGKSQQVHVAGSSILPFGFWQQASLSIPAYGMSVLTLQRGGSDNAYSFTNQENTQQTVPDISQLVCGSNGDSAFVC